MDQAARRQVYLGLLQRALTRWESLVTIAVTVLLFVLVGNTSILGIDWQPVYWLLLGALTEIALVVSTFRDPNEVDAVVSRQLERNFDMGRIKNPVSRERLDAALEYRTNMVRLISRADGSMRTHLEATLGDVNDWISHMYSLALHLESFEANELVDRDARQVPQMIEKTRIRIEREADPRVRADLESKLVQLETQQEQLRAAISNGKRAEIQLESTLASLGTVYAQMSLLGTKEVDSARAQRLRLEIQDEISGLQDTLDAMDEVQGQRLQLS
jgi:hypothetical protein